MAAGGLAALINETMASNEDITAVKEDVACGLTKASGITSVEKWMASSTPVKLGGVAPGGSPDNTGAWR